MFLTIHYCEDCERFSLEPIRPNHLKDRGTKLCGGKVVQRRFAEIAPTRSRAKRKVAA